MAGVSELMVKCLTQMHVSHKHSDYFEVFVLPRLQVRNIAKAYSFYLKSAAASEQDPKNGAKETNFQHEIENKIVDR